MGGGLVNVVAIFFFCFNMLPSFSFLIQRVCCKRNRFVRHCFVLPWAESAKLSLINIRSLFFTDS